MTAIAVIFVSAFIIILFNYLRLRKKHRTEVPFLRQRLQEQEALSCEVLDYTVRILDSLMETAALSGDNSQLLMTKLRRFIFTGDESHQGIIRYMQPIANFLCHGIVNLLRDINPKLTEEDLTFCSLLCLGFAPNSIQMLYGQSNPASFYNRRSRIRRKLGLQDGDRSLESLLNEMVTELSDVRNTCLNK